MKRTWICIAQVTGLAAGLLGLVAAVGGCEHAKAPQQAAPPPPPPVTVTQPVRREVMEWDEYTGHLEAVETVELRARVSGLIVAAPFEEGSVVQQGTVLVEIDARPFQAELDARLAGVARAAAQVKLAQIEYDRVDRLSPDVRTSTEWDAASAGVQEARAQEEAAKAAVESARLNVEWCQVKAPITGRVSSRYVTPGNLITGGTGSGTLLTTITSIDPIYCYIDVDEHSMLKYQELAREGERRTASVPVDLQLANESAFPHEGVVDFVDNRVDPNTGTIRTRGVFANPEGALTPGFFARVRVPGSGRYEALLVPDAAVATNQNTKLLYVVDPNDVLRTKQVKLGALFGDWRAIETGVGPDDRIVISGQMRTRPGMQVAPHAPEEPLAALPDIRLAPEVTPVAEVQPRVASGTEVATPVGPASETLSTPPAAGSHAAASGGKAP